MPSLTPRYPLLVTMAALYTIRSHQYNVWKSIWTVSNVRLPLTKCLSQTLLQLINKKSPLTKTDLIYFSCSTISIAFFVSPPAAGIYKYFEILFLCENLAAKPSKRRGAVGSRSQFVSDVFWDGFSLAVSRHQSVFLASQTSMCRFIW